MKCRMARNTPSEPTAIISTANSGILIAIEMLRLVEYSDEVTAKVADGIIDRLCKIHGDIHQQLWQTERDLIDSKRKKGENGE